MSGGTTAPTGPEPDDGELTVNAPTVILGVALLVVAAVVGLWRTLAHPDWAVLGVWVALGAGAALVTLGVLAAVITRWRSDRGFDRKLAP